MLLFTVQHEVKTKLVKKGDCLSSDAEAHEGATPGSASTSLPFQSPPRHCLSTTESTAMSRRVDDVVPPTPKRMEQFSVL